MPSRKPRSPAQSLVNPALQATLQRQNLLLGAWTANTTVTPGPTFTADRRCVIREIWFSMDGVPSDPDGTMLINAINFDINESTGTDDTLVSSFDSEAVVLVARKAYKATLVTETTENELTMEPGDTLRFTLVNNSAAITTNPVVNALIVYQVLTK
jgi:hypothetical protein